MSCLASPKQVNMKIQRVEWTCDKCEKPFTTFEEALRHEEQCKGHTSSSSSPKSSLHNLGEKEMKECGNHDLSKSSIVSIVSPLGTKTKNKKRKQDQAIVKYFTNKSATQPSNVIDITCSPLKIQKCSKIELEKDNKKKKAPITPACIFQPKHKKESIKATETSANANPKTKKGSSSFAPIFQRKKNVHKLKPQKEQETPKTSEEVGEHLAVEFFAKRKKEEARRKELKKKKMQDNQSTQNYASIFQLNSKKDKISKNHRHDGNGTKWKKDDKDNLPIFPRFSHVIQNGDSMKEQNIQAVPVKDSDEYTWDLHKIYASLIHCPRYPHKKPSIDQISPMSLYPKNFHESNENVSKNHLHELFSKSFSVPSDYIPSRSLLSQKYPFQDSFLNQNATAQHLLAFLQPYISLTSSHVKTTQTSSSHWLSDDDFTDSETEEEESKIYILTGPTSSGKTSLVYACAEYLECFHVLEINSSMKRGGSSLKSAIEETTLSHSSVRLTKDKNRRENAKKVTLILIDEVDNLFPEYGDAGFWSALHKLSKKSKCPIVLTSNTLPPALPRIFFNFEHGELSLLSAKECAKQLIYVANQEKYNIENENHCTDIAELLLCDMRKILLEFQFWALNGYGTVTQSTSPFNAQREISQVFPEVPEPKVHSVHPCMIPANQYTTLTICGEFSDNPKTELRLKIGSRPVLFEKVSSTILIAAVPPLQIPVGVNRHGHFIHSLLECYSCRYHRIEIEMVQHNGIVKRGNNDVSIEFLFPSIESLNDTDDERDPFTQKEKENNVEIQRKDRMCREILLKAIRKFQESSDSPADKDLSINNQLSLCTSHSKEDLYNQLKEIEELERCSKWTSDAVFLEDSLTLFDLPSISGPLRGIGNSSGDDQNNKPMGFEKLYGSNLKESSLFYGCSDTYMTQPTSGTERTLLSQEAVTSSLEQIFPCIDELHKFENPVTKADPFKFVYSLPKIFLHPSCITMMESINSMISALKYKRWKKCKDIMSLATFLFSTYGEEKMNAFCFGYSHNLGQYSHPGTLDCAAGNLLDDRLILDYIPILRSIAYIENMAENEASSEKLESTKKSNGAPRRVTRRTMKLGRGHYFDHLISGNASLAKEQWTGKRVGAHLTRHLLVK